MTPAGARPARQWERVLRGLLGGPLDTRRMAGPPFYAHAGHSAAAELRKKGLELDVEMVRIVGYAGAITRIARYSLRAESRERAERLLAGER